MALHITFEGREYPLDLTELLTLSNLRKIKQWYGLELGGMISFQEAFRLGDPDAVACAIWMARRAAGDENVPEPQNMPDFSIIGFFNGLDEDVDAQAEDGDTPDPTEATSTPGSTETQTPSEPSS